MTHTPILAELHALRAQRDELLAVAQEAAEHYARLCGDDTSYTPLRARLERASAAIARATGAQEAQLRTMLRACEYAAEDAAD